MSIRFRDVVGFLLAIALMAKPVTVTAGTVLSSVPASPDRSAFYLFYLHGLAVEQQGAAAYSRKYGKPYAYADILGAFAQRGFVVIGEMRTSGTRPQDYAAKVVDQVRQLIAAGVPAEQITVAGHSKGGLITLFVASQLRNPAINYVVLAACGGTGRRVFENFVERDAAKMTGRMLVAYDRSDDEAGSCRAALDKARDLKSEERVLQTGEGHGLFYTPKAVWLDLVEHWARKQ